MQNPGLDPAALASLDNIDFVRRLARRLLRDAHQAEDVAQDAWSVALQRGDAPANRAWLAGVVRRLALGRVRANLRRAEVEALAADGRDTVHADPTRLLDLQQLLLDGVRSLGPLQRDAIVMRYLEGCSTAEIARRCGARPEAIRQRLSRGLAELRRRLQEEDCSHGGDWRAGLAPLALPASRFAAVSVFASLKWPAIAAAACLLLFLGARLLDGAKTPPPPLPDSGAPLARLEDTEDFPLPTQGSPERSSAAVLPDAAKIESSGLAALLTVEVVDALSGAALPDARLWTDTPEGIQPATSSAPGIFTLPILPDRRIAAAAPGHVARLLPGSSEPRADNRLRISLDLAARFAGRAVFDSGSVPAIAPFDLHTINVGLPDTWPDDFTEALDAWAPWAFEPAVPLAADGSFEVDGLPADWRGGLWVHTLFRYASVTPEPAMLLDVWAQFDAPSDELELQLVELPAMRGRVLWSGDHLPVTDARVEITQTFADGSRSSRSWVPVDGSGRFEMGIASDDDPLVRHVVTRVTVRLFPSGGLVTKLKLRDLDSDGDVDLGDLVVERVPDVWIAVRSSLGEPLAGALALPVQADAPASPDLIGTDAAGLLRLSGLALDTTSILVGANGFTTLALELGEERGTPEAPLELRLEPSSSLMLAVDAPPELITRMTLELGAAGPPYAALPGVPEAALARLRSVLRGGRSDLLRPNSHSLKSDGRVTFSDLTPGAEFNLRLQSGLDGTLWEDRLYAPATGTREVAIAVSPPHLKVRGRAVDAQGRGLAGVQVGVHALGRSRYHQPLTGLDGTFSIDEILNADEPAEVSLTRLGWPATRLHLTPGLALHDLGDVQVLQGRELELTVVDVQGRSLQPELVWIEDGSGTFTGGVPTGGKLLLRGVHGVATTLQIQLGDRVHALPISASQSTARLEVQPHGKLAFSPADASPTPELLRVEGAGGGSVVERTSDRPWTLNLLPGEYRLTQGDRARTVVITAGETAELSGF